MFGGKQPVMTACHTHAGSFSLSATTFSINSSAALMNGALRKPRNNYTRHRSCKASTDSFQLKHRFVMHDV